MVELTEDVTRWKGVRRSLGVCPQSGGWSPGSFLLLSLSLDHHEVSWFPLSHAHAWWYCFALVQKQQDQVTVKKTLKAVSRSKAFLLPSWLSQCFVPGVGELVEPCSCEWYWLETLSCCVLEAHYWQYKVYGWKDIYSQVPQTMLSILA